MFLGQRFFFFWPCHVTFGILVPQPGIEPVPPAVEAQSLNHWTAREVPRTELLNHSEQDRNCIRISLRLFQTVPMTPPTPRSKSYHYLLPWKGGVLLELRTTTKRAAVDEGMLRPWASRWKLKRKKKRVDNHRCLGQPIIFCRMWV